MTAPGVARARAPVARVLARSGLVPSRGAVSVQTVVSQQWTVPGRAWTFAWRYLNDREALAREIEAKDSREWDAFRSIR